MITRLVLSDNVDNSDTFIQQLITEHQDRDLLRLLFSRKELKWLPWKLVVDLFATSGDKSAACFESLLDSGVEYVGLCLVVLLFLDSIIGRWRESEVGLVDNSHS